MKWRNGASRGKIRGVGKWGRPVLVLASLVFSLWFFFAVYEEWNAKTPVEGSGVSAESSKRLRTEVRSWFRKTFPDSAARAASKFGFFEMSREDLPVTRNDLVLLAHGLDEPGDIWDDLAPALAELGFELLEFRYPNDQPVHESSEFLMAELEVLMSAENPPNGLHLIGHSMGGLVLREFITHPDLFPRAAWRKRSPILTLIHLGTPNHGSWLSTYRLPVEVRDHLYKDYGFDALLGMIWDGAGEAQIDLKPGSLFLQELNARPFPASIYWLGIAGTGSPVNMKQIQEIPAWKETGFANSLGEIQETFPELFAGTGDGCVSIESLHCAEMNAVHYVDANHRNMVRAFGNETPPAIPIVMDLLQRVPELNQNAAKTE